MSELHSAEDIKKHIRTYQMVFGALAVLTAVTVAVAYIHLSIVPALIVALIIATVKGGLVASYFMHLISEKRIIFITLLMTFAFFIFMIILFVSAFYDQAGGRIVP